MPTVQHFWFRDGYGQDGAFPGAHRDWDFSTQLTIPPDHKVVKILGRMSGWVGGTRHGDFPGVDLSDFAVVPIAWNTEISRTADGELDTIVHRDQGVSDLTVVYQPYVVTSEITFNLPKVYIMNTFELPPLNLRRSDGSYLVGSPEQFYLFSCSLIGQFSDDFVTNDWITSYLQMRLDILTEHVE